VLVRHYLSLPIRGLILAATTGEGLTLDPHETERLVFAVRDEARKLNNLPICLGLAGSSTAVLLEMLAKTAVWPIDGYRSNVVATRLTGLKPADGGVSNPNGAAVLTFRIEAYCMLKHPAKRGGNDQSTHSKRRRCGLAAQREHERPAGCIVIRLVGAAVGARAGAGSPPNDAKLRRSAGRRRG